MLSKRNRILSLLVIVSLSVLLMFSVPLSSIPLQQVTAQQPPTSQPPSSSLAPSSPNPNGCPPGHGGTPPGHGGTPPGHGGTPPGQSSSGCGTTGGTANVVVITIVINDNGGTAQPSDFTHAINVGAQTTSGTCSPQGTAFHVADVQGSTTGTTTTINAPSCFYVSDNINSIPGYSRTSSPCDQAQPINPGQTTTCTFTYNDL